MKTLWVTPAAMIPFNLQGMESYCYMPYYHIHVCVLLSFENVIPTYTKCDLSFDEHDRYLDIKCTHI
jgi:hypothetical protein